MSNDHDNVQSLVEATDTAAAPTTAPVIVSNRTHKAELAAVRLRLVEQYGMPADWLKHCGADGLAKLGIYLGKVQIEDMAKFVVETTAAKVTNTLLPELLATEEAAKKVEIKVKAPVAEAKIAAPARVILTCACPYCVTNPKRALKGFEDQFAFPVRKIAEKLLGRPATLEDLPGLALHKTHTFAADLKANEHVRYLDAKFAIEEELAIKERYQSEKAEAETKLTNKNLRWAGECGHWVRVGFHGNKTVCLASEAMVPEMRYIVGMSREPFSPFLMTVYAVPARSDFSKFPSILQFTPLDVALGLAFPSNFPEFVQKR